MTVGNSDAAFVSKGFSNLKDATMSFESMTQANVISKLLKR